MSKDAAASNVDLTVVDEENLNYVEVPKLNSVPTHRNKSAQKIRMSPGQVVREGVNHATVDVNQKDVAVNHLA